MKEKVPGSYRVLGVNGCILVTEVLYHVQMAVSGCPVQGRVTLLGMGQVMSREGEKGERSEG